MKTSPAMTESHAAYFENFAAIGNAALARNEQPGLAFAVAHGFESLSAMRDALQAETQRLLADIRQDLETKS